MVWTSFQGNSFQSNAFQILAGSQDTETKRSGIWRLELIRAVLEQKEKRLNALEMKKPQFTEKDIVKKKRKPRPKKQYSFEKETDFLEDLKDDWIPLPKISPAVVEAQQDSLRAFHQEISRAAQQLTASFYSPNELLSKMEEEWQFQQDVNAFNMQALVALGII